jgi:hypothetical protein
MMLGVSWVRTPEPHVLAFGWGRNGDYDPVFFVSESPLQELVGIKLMREDTAGRQAGTCCMGPAEE